MHQVAVADVLFFHADDKYTCVRTAHGEHLIRTSIAELATQLDPQQFWQVHRSTIVNLAHLAGTRRDDASRLFVRIAGWPDELPVSRAYAPVQADVTRELSLRAAGGAAMGGAERLAWSPGGSMAQPQVAATSTSSDAAQAGVRATARRFMAGAQRPSAPAPSPPGLNAPAQSAAKPPPASAVLVASYSGVYCWLYQGACIAPVAWRRRSTRTTRTPDERQSNA